MARAPHKVVEDHGLTPAMMRVIVPQSLCPRRVQKVVINQSLSRATVEVLFSVEGERILASFRLIYNKEGKTWQNDHFYAEVFTRLRQRAVVKWLEGHPEVLAIGETDLGSFRRSPPKRRASEGEEEAPAPEVRLKLRHVQTTGGSTLCLNRSLVADSTYRDAPVKESHTWCFRETREFERIFDWSWQAALPGTGSGRKTGARVQGATAGAAPANEAVLASGFLGLWPVQGRLEVWALRLPQATRALVGLRPLNWPPRTRSIPFWLHQPRKPNLPRSKMPASGWAAMPSTPEPDLGPFRHSEIEQITSDTKGLTALAFRNDHSIAPDLFCLRWEAMWRCSTPTRDSSHDESSDLEVVHENDSHTVLEQVYLLPGRSVSPWVLLQRSTRARLGDVGSSNEVAQESSSVLELHRLGAGQVERVGSLKIGAEIDRSHHRLDGRSSYNSAGYHQAHSAAGKDCVRIGPVQTRQSVERSRRVREPVLKTATPPTLLILKDGSYVVPDSTAKAPPACATDCDEFSDTEEIAIVPLKGIWRIQPGGLARLPPAAKVCE